MSFDTSPNARRRRLLGTGMVTAVGLAAAVPACADQTKSSVSAYSDPMMLNLTIPASAPQTGMWSSLQTWPLVPIHMALLPSGKVLSYGAPQGKAVQDGRTYDVWDPGQGFGAGHVVLPGVTGVNSFCAAQAFRSDGSLMISGGIFDNNQDKGSVLLDKTATTISGLSTQLAADRYYASLITQADGSQIILGGDYPYAAGWSDPQGSIKNGWNAGITPEVYTPGTGWKSLFGANSREAFGPDNSRYWYPRAWVAPNGKIFGISSDKMWFLDSTGSGSITTMAFKSPPTNVASRTDAAPNTGPASTAVLYDKGKILQVGGNSMTNFNGLYYASRAATTVDINGATPVVTDIAPMNYPRSWANATLLPTGTVVVTGGSSWADYGATNVNGVITNESIQAEETWDPATGKWTLGPSASVYRGYHSSAILLQNGTVLTGGGGIPGPVSNLNAEVYYPPYLFTTVNGQAQLAPRPQIVSLGSNQLSHGQTVKIEMSNGEAISQVVLIGLSEATHSFNSGQRRSVMSFSQSGAILSAQLPASTNDAPPGYYQVVVINGKGVPSPGVFVALGAQVAAPTSATAPVGATVAQNGTAGSDPGSSGAWQKCADDGGTCNVVGMQVVAYGANGSYYFGTFSTAVNCNKGAFGDPAYGVAKACYTSPAQAQNSALKGTWSGSWQQIGVTASRVAAASDGTTVAINSQDSSLWLYQTTYWSKIGGGMTEVAVVRSGSIYSIGNDKKVYRYNGTDWGVVGTDASKLGASADGTVAVVNATTGDVWIKPTDDFQTTWNHLPNLKMKKVVPMNSQVFFGIGLDNILYRIDANGNTMGFVENVGEVAVSADGTLMVTNADDQYVWSTSAYGGKPLTARNVKASSIAAPSGDRLIAVEGDRNIYRW